MQALSIPEDMAPYRAFWAEKQQARHQRLDASYAEAVADFARITTFIIGKYNPKRIWQWGSLLHRKHFSEISDIDIALEGLDSFETYAAIWAEVSEMTAFPVDLIEMERIGLANANHIREFGRMVYERPEC